ncbi:uncharacterized protein IL334_006160 [Kwoniella shivajii]|uniref:Uncharacterized protein n=1 Tax=Kwoniella shivajii TaxID=564305 RepID=A0ABZ1D556_9TREE|nr:hypothetical protein IL334_006160 [Kwoniella shivajii]
MTSTQPQLQPHRHPALFSVPFTAPNRKTEQQKVSSHLSVLSTAPVSVSIPTSVSLSIPFFSRTSSSTSSSTDLETSYSSSSYSSSSSPGFAIGGPTGLDLRNLNLNNPYSVSTSRSNSNSRPSLIKMPNWSTWSARSSEDIARRGSTDTEISMSVTSEMDNVKFNIDHHNDEDDDDDVDDNDNDNGNGERVDKGSSIKGFRVDFGTWSRKPKIILSKRNPFKADKLNLKSFSSPKKELKTVKLVNQKNHNKVLVEETEFHALERVWARSEEQKERERRGSDWPPTLPREMVLDLSGIPNFTGDTIDSVIEADAKDGEKPTTRIENETERSTKAAEEGEEEEEGLTAPRIDTPLEMPIVPRLHLRRSHSSFLSPVLDTEEEEEVPQPKEEEKEEDLFVHTHYPSRTAFTASAFIPAPTSTASAQISALSYRPHPIGAKETVSDESPKFDLSIFSPRPPPPPVLKGIIDSIPISPLELPSLTYQNLTMTFPTPVLPRDPPTSPLTTSTSTRTTTTMATAMVMPIPRKGGPADSIESVLNPVTRRGSNASTLERDRRSSRPSSIAGSGLPRRRMSLIIKPSILPCPTPPSLLTSPKTLGSEYIPPLFSPSSISPTHSRFNDSGNGPSGLPGRRGRGSLRLKLPPSHFAESAGLGFGPTPGKKEEQDKEEHIPTPGTFGLEGENERIEQESINPYFAWTGLSA